MSLKTVSAIMSISIAIIAACTDEPAMAWFELLPFVLALVGEVFDRIPKEDGGYIE